MQGDSSGQARLDIAFAGSSCLMRKPSAYLSLRPDDMDRGAPWSDVVTLPVSRLLAIYDGLDCGAALVSADGTIRAANENAARTLRAMVGASARAPDRLPARLQSMLKREETAAVFINRGRERPCIAQRVALDVAGCSFLLLIADLNTLEPCRGDLLEHGFGLTRCEARVAVALSTGMTPTEIAKHHRISMGTVRSQLKSIFVKTGTKRQPELIAVLARLLPFAAGQPEEEAQ